MILTPTLSIGCRGTTFEVSVAQDNSTDVYLYEGVVEVRNKKTIQYLIAGEKVTASNEESTITKENFQKELRYKQRWETKEENKGSNPFAGLMDKVKKTKLLDVFICRSPDNIFQEVYCKKKIEFGAHSLVSRLAILDDTFSSAIIIRWKLNSKEISSAEYNIQPGTGFIEDHISTNGEPLNPGIYEVNFISNDKTIGKQKIEILEPEKLDENSSTENYMSGLNLLTEAISLVDAGDAISAGKKAVSADSHIRKALYSLPSLPDAQTVYEACQAYIALSHMVKASNNNDEVSTINWVNLTYKHALRAKFMCQDPQFAVILQNLIANLEENFPVLKE